MLIITMSPNPSEVHDIEKGLQQTGLEADSPVINITEMVDANSRRKYRQLPRRTLDLTSVEHLFGYSVYIFYIRLVG